MNNDEEKYQDFMHQIDVASDKYKHAHHHHHFDELAQANRDWFFHQWSYRFRSLLGNRGVIAIPNTTFEEWLYWFWEWAKAFEDDYNRFKRMVFDALNAIEQHLALIDQEIIDIFDDIQDIYNKIKNIENEIIDIYNKIKKIEEDITNIQNEINNITLRIQNTIPKQTTSGHLNEAWRKMANEKEAGFDFRWDWIDSQNHKTGCFGMLNANYIESVKNDGKALDSILGTIDVPKDWANSELDGWIYSGYVVHMDAVGSQELFLHIHKLKSTDNFLTVEVIGKTGDYNKPYTRAQINMGGASYIYFGY